MRQGGRALDGTDRARFARRTFEHASQHFISRNFTEAEVSYCRGSPHPAASFAGRWAAKEAVIKALSSCSKESRHGSHTWSVCVCVGLTRRLRLAGICGKTLLRLCATLRLCEAPVVHLSSNCMVMRVKWPPPWVCTRWLSVRHNPPCPLAENAGAPRTTRPPDCALWCACACALLQPSATSPSTPSRKPWRSEGENMHPE
jgi:hypothetical protein